MDKMLMQKQIAAAILGQNQLVFTYKKEKVDPITGKIVDQIVVRYVTPIEMRNPGEQVKCVQHLPSEGYRNFKLDKIVNFHRVLTIGMPTVESDAKKADAVTAGAAGAD